MVQAGAGLLRSCPAVIGDLPGRFNA